MLRILALETSELLGSVAVAEDDKILADLELGAGQRSAQSLAPAIHAILAKVGWHPKDVDVVAVTVGPGSFTGLRIGVTTAKVFAYAVGAEVIGISTLETIAAAAPPEVNALSVLIDAQRGDVVVQGFCRSVTGQLDAGSEARLVSMADWIGSLTAGTVLTGPVLRKWQEPFPSGVVLLDAEFWRPRAANVARLAYRDFTAGRRDDVWTLLPTYSRSSAAEEKLGKMG